MSNPSTVPAVKFALRNQLAARPGLTGVDVSYGVPTSQHKEWVWLGGITDQSFEATGMHGPGGMPQEEEYDLNVIVHVEQSGRDQQRCDERLYQLVAEIQDQLQSDPQVGGVLGSSGGWARLSRIPSMEPSRAGDGVVSLALLFVHVQAHD